MQWIFRTDKIYYQIYLTNLCFILADKEFEKF